jgi:hypothetical protein
MNAGPPQRPEGHHPRRPHARPAAWCVSAGAILGTPSLTCLALGAVSGQQAIALGLPGALLIVGGLIAAAVPDAATGQRLGFQAGFQMGWLLGRLLSVLRPRRNGFY